MFKRSLPVQWSFSFGECMEPKLSVVVPVYNVEPYLVRALESIRNQTYGNLEILCVDDGSTDGSWAILDGYQKRDRRFVCVKQANQGVAAARNAALELATGEYVAFVDPDDWVEEDAYELMMSRMQEASADIGVFNFYKTWDDHETKMTNDEFIPSFPFGGEEYMLYSFKRYSYAGFCAYLWNKIYSMNYLHRVFGRDTRLFAEDLAIGEDVLFSGVAGMNAECVVYIDQGLYHYYQRTDSLFHGGTIAQREGSLVCFERLILCAEKWEMPENVVDYLKRFFVYHSSLLAKKAYDAQDWENLDKYKGCIRRYLTEYERTSGSHSEWNERMRMILEL